MFDFDAKIIDAVKRAPRIEDLEAEIGDPDIAAVAARSLADLGLIRIEDGFIWPERLSKLPTNSFREPTLSTLLAVLALVKLAPDQFQLTKSRIRLYEWLRAEGLELSKGLRACLPLLRLAGLTESQIVMIAADIHALGDTLAEDRPKGVPEDTWSKLKTRFGDLRTLAAMHSLDEFCETLMQAKIEGLGHRRARSVYWFLRPNE